jgi:hypothetical protein
MGSEAGYVMFGRNFHVVLPGRVFRCAQLTAAGLEQTVRDHGIRTVVNLRGCGVNLPWYMAECRATHRLNISQEDISLSASRLPSVHEIHQLVGALDGSDYPILLHCRQGADRTGLASFVVLLLEPGSDLATARRQLGLRYGHVRLQRAGHLDRFCDLYTEWLADQGLGHSAAVFRQWLDHGYCPGECRSALEALELPTRLRRGEPARARVRVHNTSLKPWHFRPENNAGIHLIFQVKDAQERGVTSGRAGLFEAKVRPGASLDLVLVIPGIKIPGRYRLLVDMVDEQHCWFYQVGSEPLEAELEVHD